MKRLPIEESDPRYKTELCMNAKCPYGVRCEFAHGVGELRKKSLVLLALDGRIPSTEKFRRFPCKTFILTGYCPYADRCVFLHDPRLKSAGEDDIPLAARTREDFTKDTFFWPDMLAEDVDCIKDDKDIRTANQCYIIPRHFASFGPNKMHDNAIFSIWNNFCNTVSSQVSGFVIENPNGQAANSYLRKRRLPIFQTLASGIPIVSKSNQMENDSDIDSGSSRISRLHRSFNDQKKLLGSHSFSHQSSEETKLGVSTDSEETFVHVPRRQSYLASPWSSYDEYDN